MSLVTVAELRATLGVGTLYPDATLQEVCDAADAVLLPMLWVNQFYISGSKVDSNVATVYFTEPHPFIAGESVTIANCGAALNGSKTIISVGTYHATFTVASADYALKRIAPYGTATAATTTDWTADSAVQTAALEIAVDIWQSRQITSSGGVSPDFQPSPYRMGNTLMARVRGLIAHALSPNSMVG